MKTFVWLMLMLSAAGARAAVSISASVNRTAVAMGDQIVLSVSLSGDQASLPQPKLPALDGFSVYDSGRSQNLSFVNGKMSSEVVYTFVLSPRSVGKFTIPPISADGAAAPTAPLDVEVTSPSAQPHASAPAAGPRRRGGATRTRGNEIFVVASLDKSRATVNEQVTLTVRFYNSVQLIGDVRYDPPALNGFLTEDLPPVRNGMTTLEGRTYQFNEVKIALFPVQPGRLTIGSASVHCQVARMGGGGGDFFDRFFSMATPQPVTVRSEPLSLAVDPVPANKPADFTGVVGQLSARAEVDRASVKAGDAVSLSVAVSGRGNIKSVPDPAKPDVPSLRFFETESSVSVDKSNDRVGGSKTFRTVLVPRVSGDVKVPPMSFSYYDPERRTFGRTSTAEISLHVAPGAAGSAAAMPPSLPSSPGLTAIADDIRYLKPPSPRNPLSAILATFADLGPLHSLPFVILAAAGGIAWRRRARQSDPKGRRFREALPRAEQRLAQALRPDTDAARAAALVDEALTAFAADKLDLPAAGLTLKIAVDGLAGMSRPPSEKTMGLLKSAWEESHLRRFAPGAAGADAQRFAQDALSLLRLLDSEIRR